MQIILSCQALRYGCFDILNIKFRPLYQILLTKQDVARSVVPILTTRELVAPFESDPIMSGDQHGHLDKLNIKIVGQEKG